jgi:predicted CXXCH cytochrome family protein
MRPGLLIGVAAAAFLTAAAFAQAPALPARSSAYVGSTACQSCHEPQYGSWKSTLHVQMTKPIAEAKVLGDFRPGAKLEAYGRAFTMETRDGRYFIAVSKNGRPEEKFEVNYTLGARRFQGYLSTLPDGRIYVLPVFWHNETKRWIDYKEITPIPDDPDHDLRQIWNVTCVNCHATNLVKHYSAATDTYATTWTEMGIGCEACHGPGQAHIADPGHKMIFSTNAATSRQIFDACGYCHGNKNNMFFGFRPGDRYEDYALPFLISQPIPANDPQGDFWPDGRPSRFNRPQALTLTGCFQSGQATCTSCHRMHGSANAHMLKVPVETPEGGHTRQSDQLCTQCHAVGAGGPSGAAGAPIGDLSAHTHHAPASQGSRCIECHMSDVNWRLITRRRDHTFQPPVPEMTARYGVPNACTSCHEDKSPEWAATTMDAWYGNRERRQSIVAMADTIYRAGAGDTNALTDVAQLAVNRSHGALIRASAAEFAGQLMAGEDRPGGAGGSSVAHGVSPAVVNALIGASADPEAMVRTTAVRSLALTREPRVAPVLAAHLADSARLVRVGAAEGLLALGITRLDGAAGEALARAQDEWAASLRTFDDDAADHSTLGWLEASRGRNEEAARELKAAITLDPSAARPHVYLGVLAARAGRYEEALLEFKTAKSLAAGYPNIDRLIEEVQKRR